MVKLNRILLIDDSESDNYIHDRRLKKMEVAQDVIVRVNGQQGLDYLTTPLSDGTFPRPEIIFLDINMPVMGGWDFLDHFRNLPPAQKQGTLIVAMLTESLTDRDHKLADDYLDVIDERGSKPLTREYVLELIDKYHGEAVSSPRYNDN